MNNMLAFEAIKKHKVRSVLTMLTISIGIAAVVMIFAAGAGLRGFIAGEIAVFGTDIVEIETKVPNVGKTSTENAQGQALGITITTFKNKDLDAIRKDENITAIYGAVMGQEAVGYREELKKMMLMGVSYEAPDVDNTEVKSGRFFSREEENGLAQVAVLGFEAKKKLFGDDEAVGESISIKGKKYRVVGVMAERGAAFIMNLDDIIYLPLKTMQKRLLGIDHITFAVAKMKDGSQGKQTQDRLIEVMREQHDITDPIKDDFAVNTMDEAQDMMGNIISSITSLLVALVCISLVVGGVGIMNIMYVSVAERTFEIGLRKAVGAKRKDILWQFLSEALLITLGGGIIGVILGAILAFIVKIVAVNYGLMWTYQISLTSILIAVGFSVVVGLVFGIYPARQAARLEVVDALRRE